MCIQSSRFWIKEWFSEINKTLPVYRFHVMYACSALFTVTLVSELDLEAFTVCTGILQVTESEYVFVQWISCYCNNNVRISKMLQGSLSTSESVNTFGCGFDQVCKIGLHVVCSECKKENQFESYMPFVFYLSNSSVSKLCVQLSVLIRDTQALSTLLYKYTL